jgi:hypothetical protein
MVQKSRKKQLQSTAEYREKNKKMPSDERLQTIGVELESKLIVPNRVMNVCGLDKLNRIYRRGDASRGSEAMVDATVHDEQDARATTSPFHRKQRRTDSVRFSVDTGCLWEKAVWLKRVDGLFACAIVMKA